MNRYVPHAVMAVLIITSVFASSALAQSPYMPDTNFGNAINLSNDAGSTGSYDMASSGSNVYVVWSESISVNPDIFFKMSKDNGTSFGNVINLSKNPGNSIYPKIAVSGNNVYVVWQDDSPGNKEIFFSRSTDNGASFSIVNLSNNAGDSELPQIIASGSNVYVAWRDNAPRNYEILPRTYEILFVASNDNGATFRNVLNLSNNAGTSSNPVISASGSNVYVVWQDNTPGNWEIFFSKSTDNGASFGQIVNLSNNPGNSINPQMATSGSSVYVAWFDDINIFFRASNDNGSNFGSVIILCSGVGDIICGDSGSLQVAGSGSNAYAVWPRGTSSKIDIFFSRSADNGASFSSALNLSNTSGSTSNARLAVSGNNVYVVWQDQILGNADIFFRASNDNGATFRNVANLSNNAGTSSNPVISASGNNVYVVWSDNTPGNGQTFFRAGTAQIPSVQINIDSVNNPKPRWDLDSVTISGTVNGLGAYTITVDWGDGTSTAGISSSGGSWGQTSHTYNSTHIGTNQIVAKLMDKGAEKASSVPYPIDVNKHATNLTMNTIASVAAGSDITVTGSLIDADAKKGIGEKTVTFNGTGTAGVEFVVTKPDGSFSSKGKSSIDAVTNLTVQAHFAGDDLFLPSNSPTINYDTLKHAIVEPTKSVQISNIVLLDQADNKLTEVSAGEQVLVQGGLENKQNQAQSLVYIVQIKDANGQTAFLSWIKSILQKGQSMKPAIGWIPDAPGKYAIEIFVWDSLSNPQALSEVHRVELAVR